MKGRVCLSTVLTVSVVVFGVWSQRSSADEAEHRDQDAEMEHHHQADAVESMGAHHQHDGLHMKWTTLRPRNR